ncbi:cupredoxin domain-containing protein, partial [Mycobacterium kansasii]
MTIAGLAWYFFARQRAATAAVSGGVQRVQVTIRGGYSPKVIQVRQGIPVEIEFDRQESGDCTSRVVFPDLLLSAALRAHRR